MNPEHRSGYQTEPGTVRWKVHFTSAPSEVYRAVSTPLGRSRFWALSAKEQDGAIHFVQPGGAESTGRVLDAVLDRRYAVEYFDWVVTFVIDAAGTGAELTMTCTRIAENARMEVSAGWVSVLLGMKASVDFGVDLRNHDPARTWRDGYVEGA